MTDGGPDILNPHDLMEAFTVPEIYADGIAMVEKLSGENICITCYRFMRLPGSKAVTRTVTGRIIGPKSSLATGQVLAMLEALEETHVGMGG